MARCAFTHGDHYVCEYSQRGQGNGILCCIVFQYMVETAIALCFISFTHEPQNDPARVAFSFGGQCGGCR